MKPGKAVRPPGQLLPQISYSLNVSSCSSSQNKPKEPHMVAEK